MAIIATLAVSIQARTKKLTAGLGRASKAISRFAKSIARTSINIAKFASVAVAAAAAGLVILVKRSLLAIDEAGKLSDILNITTEDLIAFRLAAELAGGSAAGFDKLLGIFVRRLGEAKQGLGEAAKVLEELGLNIDDLVKLDTTVAIGMVTDEINKLGTAAEINAARYQIFGRQGLTAGNQLAQGSEGFRLAREEADRLNITVSRVDAAKIEAANDSFTRLGAVIQGISNTIAVQFSPFIEEANKRLVEFGLMGEGAGLKIVNAFEGAVKATAKISQFFNSLRAIAESLVGVLLRLFSIFTKGLDISKDFERAADLTFEQANKRFADVANKRTEQRVTNFFDNIRKNAEESAKAITENINQSVKLNDTIDKIEKRQAKAVSGKITFAREINLTRTAITGLGGRRREQRVIDPQLQTTNQLLNDIRKGVGGGMLAVAQ